MAHGHSHLPDDPHTPQLDAPRSRLVVWAALGLVALLTAVGLVVLWPREQVSVELDEGFGFSAQLVDATVTRVDLVPCSGVGEAASVRCELVTTRVDEGPTRGDTATFELFLSANSPRLDRGDAIVLSYAAGAPPELAYQFADYQRGTAMWWLAGLFVAAVVALGRWKGLRALAGVGISLAIIVSFLLPALLLGDPPVLLSIVACSTIAFLALFLAHGFNDRTAVALLGTLISLGLTGALAVAFVSLTRITGLASEEALLLQAGSGIIDFEGLLLAGIMIGALGVLDDVTVTQVAAVWELKRADERFGAWELYRRAVNVGRDHIASVVNTLALAYAGAALPLLLLFTQAQRSFTDVVTGEAVAVEVVRTLVGSIGLVAAVPITTGLAALVIAGATVTDADADDDTGRPRPARRGTARRRGRRDPFWDDSTWGDEAWDDESPVDAPETAVDAPDAD